MFEHHWQYSPSPSALRNKLDRCSGIIVISLSRKQANSRLLRPPRSSQQRCKVSLKHSGLIYVSASLIICLFQLVFLAGTVFSLTTNQPEKCFGFSTKRMGPWGANPAGDTQFDTNIRSPTSSLKCHAVSNLLFKHHSPQTVFAMALNIKEQTWTRQWRNCHLIDTASSLLLRPPQSSQQRASSWFRVFSHQSTIQSLSQMPLGNTTKFVNNHGISANFGKPWLPSFPLSFSSNSSVSELKFSVDPWASLTFEEVKTAFFL